MKNAIAFFLLFIFTLNLGGTYVIFKIQQHQIRREIKQEIKKGISQKDLTSITVSTENENELIWKDHEEFSYKGMMYDVVYVEILNKTTKIYHCISDTQENNLIAQYQKDLQKKQKNKNNRTNSVKTVKFLQKINPLPQKDELAFSKKIQVSNFDYQNNYSPLSLEISSPPPKQVL
ncbi:hypothetical protein Aeqsu_0758 [Aequorivita sublithincola DSM 14238]|uniref:Uncharacterized protein n=1 Tax=Aequorivita sublithincola (strain DSM 14238 / LMG 21431 / ACAM 643 / 9-3) TaxID=746697 RepID=I3YTE7_AEQSU|nr:hypothetical protein [Aequorivita sublithincola]AFL80265.1 hypothetical protein Aeqsu_0758 [Aequorivita sublithincola DSM 14238]